MSIVIPTLSHGLIHLNKNNINLLVDELMIVYVSNNKRQSLLYNRYNPILKGGDIVSFNEDLNKVNNFDTLQIGINIRRSLESLFQPYFTGVSVTTNFVNTGNNDQGIEISITFNYEGLAYSVADLIVIKDSKFKKRINIRRMERFYGSR